MLKAFKIYCMERKIITQFGLIVYTLQFKKVKNIIIKIRENGDVCVSAPLFASESDVERLLLLKAKWIFSVKQKMQVQRQKKLQGNPNEIYILDEKYTLIFVASKSKKIEIKGNYIIVNGASQEKMITMVKNLIFSYAEKVFLARYEFYKQKFNVDFDLGFSLAKTWWGVCKPKTRQIRLCYALIARPIRAIDAVICHEIAHIKENNHKKGFYEHLYSIYPTYKEDYALIEDYKYYFTDKLLINRC